LSCGAGVVSSATAVPAIARQSPTAIITLFIGVSAT
jgi:hypothetical protein